MKSLTRFISGAAIGLAVAVTVLPDKLEHP